MIKTGKDRRQMEMVCLDAMVAQDSIVRVIDIFVEISSLDKFEKRGTRIEGRPGYSTSDLLKLYLYSYMTKTRTSRDIAKSAIMNNEVRWLIRDLRPCHMTIANFRKTNEKGFKDIFRQFNRFLKSEDAFDEDTVAVDGALFQGQNSTSNNYTEEKLDTSMKQVETRLTQYLSELDANDKVDEEQQIDTAKKLEQLKARKKNLLEIKQQLEQDKQNGQTQVSLTDPDARRLVKSNERCVGYNVVTAAEVKNKFIVGVHVTNKNDINELSEPSIEAKQSLGKTKDETIKTTADRGFDSGSELKNCTQNNIETYVAPRKRKPSGKKAAFKTSKFTYNKEQDYYLCPQGQRLTTNGKVYQKKRKNEPSWNRYCFTKYMASSEICRACAHFNECCSPSENKRIIERSEYQDFIDGNLRRMAEDPSVYKKRMGTIEHPFGTIKRQWGYNYTLLKTLPKVTGEFNLIFTAYNLRRAINVFGTKDLLRRLKALYFYLFSLFQGYLDRIRSVFSICESTSNEKKLEINSMTLQL